jgi:hypothetical protein
MNDSILKGIADNPALLKAVRDVIEEQFNLDEIPTTMTNEAMGQVVRARVEGLKKIDKAFIKIASYATFSEKKASVNPAR